MEIKNNEELKEHYEKRWKEGGYKSEKMIGGIDIRALYDEERKSRAISFIKPNKKEIILDAGCGNGLFSTTLSRSFKKVYAIDITKRAFKETQARKGNKVCFIEGNIENLQFEDEFFDKIVCIEVLEHLLNPLRALRELSRVLSPKGSLVLTYPLFNKTMVRQMEKKLRIRKLKKIDEHLSEWSYSELINALKYHGLQMERVEGIACDFGWLIGKLMEKSNILAGAFIYLGLKIKKFPRNSFFVAVEAKRIDNFKIPLQLKDK